MCVFNGYSPMFPHLFPKLDNTSGPSMYLACFLSKDTNKNKLVFPHARAKSKHLPCAKNFHFLMQQACHVPDRANKKQVSTLQSIKLHLTILKKSDQSLPYPPTFRYGIIHLLSTFNVSRFKVLFLSCGFIRRYKIEFEWVLIKKSHCKNIKLMF